MRRSLVLVLLFVVVGCLFLLKWQHNFNATALPPAHGKAARTEERWIAEEIVRDLAEIIFVAKNGPSTKIAGLKIQCQTQGHHAFEISVDSPNGRVAQKFELKHHLWTEENYAPVAQTLLSTWGIPAQTAGDENDTELLDRLMSGEMADVIRDSKTVSEELTRAPLDAALHEKAALILGCFALREAAGTFSDTRPALNRISAHLALASALQSKEGDFGKLAEIIQLSLIGRQAEAMEKITSLPAALDRWARLLKLRTTGDWRLLAQPDKGSLLEQLEYFRALRQRGRCPKSRAFLSEIHAGPRPEWTRVAMEENLSVAEGHAFAHQSVIGEAKSIADDWQTFSGDSLSEAQFVDALNRPATRCVNETLDGRPQLEVLSWGMLAAFHQRHLCNAMVRTEYFLQCTWGVKEEAKEFRAGMERFFTKVTLYPIVKRFFKTEDREEAAVLQNAIAVSRDHPELVTAANWSMLNPKIEEDRERALPHDSLSWFADFPLFGTTYDFAGRCHRVRDGTKPVVLEPAAVLAPFDHEIIRNTLHAKFNGHETGEQAAAAYAGIKDFDLRAMWQIAEGFKDRPEIYGKLLPPICDLHPDYFIILGQYYVDKKMPREAAAAYQNAFDRAEDRVYMANASRWIVDYYFDNGRVDDALKIATDAAEVYSYAGLSTMAHLMERMERYPKAEDYYKKIRDRYDDSHELDSFYERNRDRDPEYARAADVLKKAAFPAGIESAQLKDFNDPPRDGVSIASTNTLVAGARLKPGDVIVAINGTRVRSEKQYIYIRDMESGPNMTLVVWNGTRYSERKLNLPKRRLYCKLADFKAH